MNLFDQAHEDRLQKSAPLAARMRPRTLDEYVGQAHIIGPGRLLRRSIQADQLGSLIFYGPPGTGKTTLAQVIANTTKAHFIALNAVLSGVKEIREAIAEAQQRAKLYTQRTILFIDEVHRFNKAQQDALLPWVENGTVIFIGATTENPYFEVNKALVSRSRIFQLIPLTKDDLRQVIQQALTDKERGYGNLNVVMDDDALEHLVEVANGDARAVLNALELAVETTAPTDSALGELAGAKSKIQNSKSKIHITLSIAEESIQRRAVLYDKEGDYHFDTISAFIKSLRGSDPDAALYWMAKMIYAGEAPRFIFRRMLIFAGEDVGMADPNAIQVVTACAAAFEQVGLPEGRFHLATAALYLATAKKSNTTFAFFDALTQVEKEADSGVPNHLRDANRDKEGFGHGEGYLYPHAYRDHWVAQQYLPTSLQGKVFYEPSDQGYEAQIRVEVARRREAQLAAMLAVEEDADQVLTFSPQDVAKDRWLQRTISNTGERLGHVRDRVLDAAQVKRHSLVLDLKAASGLLTWEALRRAPEGGVYALARMPRDADALTQQAARLSEIEQPIVLTGSLFDLPSLLDTQPSATRSAPPAILFDALIGYNALLDIADKATAMLAVEEDADQVLTFSPQDVAKDRWLQRTISNTGERLGHVRDRVLDAAQVKRHSLVLDLKAASGLLTWEALRRVPEGGVYALTRTPRDAEALTQQAARLSEIERPLVLAGSLLDLPSLLDTQPSATRSTPPAILFDALIGYNALLDIADKATAIKILRPLLAENGALSLAERVSRHTQRLYQLVDLTNLDKSLVERIIQAEEAIYNDASDPLVNWDVEDLVKLCEDAGLTVVTQTEEETTELQVTPGVIERWFGPSLTSRPSYGDRLAAHLSASEIKQLRARFEQQLLNQVVSWRGRLVYLTASYQAKKKPKKST